MSGKYSVLIIGSGEEYKEALLDLLERDGYDACQEDFYDEALKRMETSMPDLILLDIFPNGCEIIDRLQKHSKLRNIPVIFMSSVNGGIIDRGFELGATDCVLLPFNRSELRARIKTHIKLKVCNDTLSHLHSEFLKASGQPEDKTGAFESAGMEGFVEELNRAIQTDFLTGLGNRRYIFERIEEATSRARETGEMFAILLGDLDHFKLVNDKYGHDCGDKALKCVAEIFRETVRESDIVARWGGEEFMFLFPAVSKSKALELGERIRKNVENAPVYCGNARVDIKITIGVSFFRIGDETAQEVINRADAALYQGKNNGRNQVVLL